MRRVKKNKIHSGHTRTTKFNFCLKDEKKLLKKTFFAVIFSKICEFEIKIKLEKKY